jgi:hypothetical protein
MSEMRDTETEESVFNVHDGFEYFRCFMRSDKPDLRNSFLRLYAL